MTRYRSVVGTLAGRIATAINAAATALASPKGLDQLRETAITRSAISINAAHSVPTVGS
jgi:hypothetical protein